jgi:DNA excision repair protein ERCC-4
MKTETQDIVVIQDSREQDPLRFNLPTVRRGLKTGDYSLQGLEDQFTVERKSLPDLIGSLTHDRERFFRELVRMKDFTFRRLLVIGRRQDIVDGNYRSLATPRSLLASLAVIEIRYNTPVVYASTPGEASELIETWAKYFHRERMTPSATQEDTHKRGDSQDVQSIAQGTPRLKSLPGGVARDTPALVPPGDFRASHHLCRSTQRINHPCPTFSILPVE